MGIYDSYYRGVYGVQRPSVYQQQGFASWLLQEQMRRLLEQQRVNMVSRPGVSRVARPRLRNERFEVVESRVVKLAAVAARRAARENRVHGSPRASPSGTLRYEYGIYAEKYGPIKALGIVRRHFEGLGYKTSIPHSSPRASSEATEKYMRGLEREFAPRVSVEELSGYLKPVPVTGSGIPHSTTLNPSLEDKRLSTIVDKYVEAPSRALETSIIKPLEAWVRERAGEARKGSIGGAAGLLAGSLALSGLKFLQGAYEGATSIFRPWSLADSVATATRMGPGRLIGYYASNPLEVSRLVGGFAGGYFLGSVAGKLYSGLRARFGKPDYSGEFELVPRDFEKLKMEVSGRQGFLVRRMTYVERGVARPVYSLGREQGLLGEYSIRGMRSGDYAVFIGEGYRLPGRELFRIPVKSTGSALGAPENVFGTGYRIYGFEKPGSPIIYSFEKVFYRGKPVHFSGRILTGVRVFEHRPSFLVRAAYWVGRRLGLTKKVPGPRFSYAGLGAGKTFDYVIDLRGGPVAGGVSTGSLVQGFAKPSVRVRVPVFISKNFGEITGLLGGLSIGFEQRVSRGSVKSFISDRVSGSGFKSSFKPVSWLRSFIKMGSQGRSLESFRTGINLRSSGFLKNFLRDLEEAGSKSLARSSVRQAAGQSMVLRAGLMYGEVKTSVGRPRVEKWFRSLFFIPSSGERVRRGRRRGRRREKYFERVNPFNL